MEGDDGLVGRAFERVQRYDRTGDAAEVVGPEVDREMDLLSEATLPNGDWPVPAVTALAVLRLFRARALGTPEAGPDQNELFLARTLFTMLFTHAPELVPGGLYPMLVPDEDVMRGLPSFMLDGTVEMLRAAVSATADEHPDRVYDLGKALLTRFERTGSADDVDEAVGILRHHTAVEPGRHDVPRPPGARDPLLMSLLGQALRTRFAHTGDPAALTEAVDYGHRAVAALTAGHADRALVLSGLGGTLIAWFEHTGSSGPLDEAISVARETVAATSVDAATGVGTDVGTGTSASDPNRALALSGLAAALSMRCERTGSLSDLDEAIGAARDAVAAIPADHPQRSSALSALAHCLCSRFEHKGDLADVDEAIDLDRRAVACIPPGSPDLPMTRANMALSLFRRFERTGVRDELDEAVGLGRQALEESRPDDPLRGPRLANLGGFLLARFEVSGALADLDESVRLLRQGEAAIPEGHPARSVCRNSLVTALQRQFERHGELACLDEAVAAGRTAVAATPEDDPHHAMYQSSLCLALSSRYPHTRDPQDLEAAVTAGRAAVAATPEGHPRRGLYQSGLARALVARMEISGDPGDPDETVLTVSRAVEATPEDHPDHGLFLHNLGVALMMRHYAVAVGGSRGTSNNTNNTNPADLEHALTAMRRSAELPAAQTATRLRAARSWAGLALDLPRPDPAASLAGYRLAIDLAPRLAWPGLDFGDQAFQAHFFAGLACDAAACALEVQRPTYAVELLEQGRAVLWGHVLQRRSDLTVLRAADPGLGERLERVRRALDRPVSPATTAPLGHEDRAALAKEFDLLVDRARGLPGCADFLRPVPFERLSRAADRGPVVIVNLSRHRCDALLVHADRVDPLPLATTFQEAEQQAAAYLTAVTERAAARSGPRALAAEERIGEVLAWLWRSVAEPVLLRLGHASAPGAGMAWPRVWWCPTGPLGLLPLHAAGLNPYEHPGRSVLDRVVSSYTLTLAALEHARRPLPPARREDGGMLLVSLGETPGAPRLEGPGQEASLLGGLLAPAPLRLEGSQATRERVRSLLRTHRWFHFSGHGTQDLGDPTRGGLRLHDAVLTVHDLANLDLDPGGELAFLSACRTGLGGGQVPDEGIHLASALQLAGYRNVIATLWNVHDAPAARLTGAVYEQLITDGIINPAHAAEALHHAVRSLRSEHPYEPGVWAPFLHTGP
ncbi:CHAT domain-containing protein [Streptomyces sp. KLMMK]|uniref:CHAT domain-containing protein n=1 Tax=Streptomyces sp. KLMMK TaxID=3109353 RepID=UPI002FFE30F2